MKELFQDKLLETIRIMVEQYVSKLKFDYSFIGKVTADNGGIYDVEYMGETYPTKAREGLTLTIGDVVYVRVVKGNLATRFIDCKKP